MASGATRPRRPRFVCGGLLARREPSEGHTASTRGAPKLQKILLPTNARSAACSSTLRWAGSSVAGPLKTSSGWRAPPQTPAREFAPWHAGSKRATMTRAGHHQQWRPVRISRQPGGPTHSSGCRSQSHRPYSFFSRGEDPPLAQHCQKSESAAGAGGEARLAWYPFYFQAFLRGFGRLRAAAAKGRRDSREPQHKHRDACHARSSLSFPPSPSWPPLLDCEARPVACSLFSPYSLLARPPPLHSLARFSTLRLLRTPFPHWCTTLARDPAGSPTSAST